MINRKIQKRKRKNPDADIIEILDSLKPYEENIPFESLSEGAHGETYIFKINFKKVLDNNTFLKPGEYLIKRFFNDPHEGYITKKEIEHLLKLSKYGLIPKIYYISKEYVIMKYIKADTLLNCYENNSLSKLEIDKILGRLYFLIEKWHKLGFAHGDLQMLGNILVTSKNQVYLIDPGMSNDKRKDLSDLRYIENKLNDPSESEDDYFT